MPSPVGHTIVALALHALTARDKEGTASLRRAAVFVGAAVAPDLDLLLRFIDGRNHHQAESHSIGCAAIMVVVGPSTVGSSPASASMPRVTDGRMLASLWSRKRAARSRSK